jgi:hypothetical protein
MVGIELGVVVECLWLVIVMALFIWLDGLMNTA